MRKSFYLASHDYISSPQPRKCELLGVVHAGARELFRVQVDIPIPHRPFHQDEPIESLLLGICDPALSLTDVGKKPVIVDILLPASGALLLETNLSRIGTGTLHTNREEAARFSALEKDEL